MSKLIFGCGYLGQRVARAWRDAGHDVVAVTRSNDRARHFAEQGWRAVVADITQAVKLDGLTDLDDVDTVLFAVGFDRRGDQSIHEVYVEGLARVLDALPSSVRRFIYISSTGVYGESGGAWVDERTRCAPTRDGGKACLAAEALLSERLDERRIVLRLAGIYGPARLPQQKLIETGQPIEAAPDAWLNLIHVDDAVQAVLAAESIEPSQLIVVSDGAPVARRDFYRTLAAECNAPEPTFSPPSPGSSRAARARGDKRIDNAKMRELLPFDLKYPSYREGLRAIVGSETVD